MATGIGDVLRSTRRERGRSLADAARDTRVRETYLAALEQEEFDALGGDVYVRGFLTSYAKFLDLDPAPLLDAYRRRGEAKSRPATSEPPPQTTIRLRRPLGAMLVVVLLILVMGVVLALGLGDGVDAAVVGG